MSKQEPLPDRILRGHEFLSELGQDVWQEPGPTREEILREAGAKAAFASHQGYRWILGLLRAEAAGRHMLNEQLDARRERGESVADAAFESQVNVRVSRILNEIVRRIEIEVGVAEAMLKSEGT